MKISNTITRTGRLQFSRSLFDNLVLTIYISIHFDRRNTYAKDISAQRRYENLRICCRDDAMSDVSPVYPKVFSDPRAGWNPSARKVIYLDRKPSDEHVPTIA